MEPGFEKHAFHLQPNVSVFGADKETGMGRGFGFVTFGAKSCEFPRDACLGLSNKFVVQLEMPSHTQFPLLPLRLDGHIADLKSSIF